jgi:hypothetical protein
MEKFPISVVVYLKDEQSRLITFPDVSAISIITTTNDSSLNILLNGQYSQLTIDENTELHMTGNIKISIFTDGSGNNYALDSNNNPIISKLVTQTVYTYPYIDASENSIDGYLTMYFDDGSYFGNNDTNNAAYWYWLDGLPLEYKQLT